MTPPDKFALPTVLVLFGATGDLVRRKIVPALYYLDTHHRLPELLQVIGYARRPLSDDQFRAEIRSILSDHNLTSDRHRVDQFLAHFFYQPGNFNSLRDFRYLATRLGRVDETWRVCANKLFYLAVPPQFYPRLFNNLARSGLTTPCSPDEGWTRVIVEKPFGENTRTAQALDNLLGQLFREEQIYRIDHYLAKEMLQNILTFRFSNNLMEESWSNRTIERIDIRLFETIGVENRGAFYDGVGALRDVGQNHLLQMLALVTMDRPDSLTAPAIRTRRAEILRQLRPITPAIAARRSARAQYIGYQTIFGVAPQSTTETYFRIETELISPRWQGVPIRLEAGKRMDEVKKEVVITFRHPRPCLCPTITTANKKGQPVPPAGGHYRNQVIFQLEPREAITIDLWTKQPGFDFAVDRQNFNFVLSKPEKQHQYVEEYAKLLLDCILGDQTLFVSTEEVTAMWAAIDPFIKAWRAGRPSLLTYRPGTGEAQVAADQMFHDHARSQHHREAIGMVGLGKMGSGLAQSLLEKGWSVVGWDQNPSATEKLVTFGLQAATDLKALVAALPTPRVIWLMVPAFTKAQTSQATGTPVDEVIQNLLPHLTRGDTIIDGGNSYYKDTIRRARTLKRRGIFLVDVGVSGGPAGARSGAAFLVGGDARVVERLRPLLSDLAAPGGWQFIPGSGAGHFAKMIHNGIEYGMMQAIAEGFEILRAAPYDFDLTAIADVYNHGSVIESRLIGWLAEAFRLHGEELSDVSSTVDHTGEGAWTVETAQKLGLESKIIAGALEFRKQSAKNPRYAGKILSALREQFGGHRVLETQKDRGKADKT